MTLEALVPAIRTSPPLCVSLVSLRNSLGVYCWNVKDLLVHVNLERGLRLRLRIGLFSFTLN